MVRSETNEFWFVRDFLTRGHGADDVHEGRVPVGLGHGGVDRPLDGGVRVEVDGPGGRHAHQVGAQALEQPADALGGNDVPGKGAMVLECA